MSKNHPTNLCAEDFMQRTLVLVQASDTLPDAERLLSDAGVSGAPVVDQVGHLLGVISIRDLVRHRAEDSELPEDVQATVFDDPSDDADPVAFARPPSGACAADIMTQEVVSVPPSMPLPLVAERMVEARVHRVMVIDRGKLVGLVSSTEMLRVMAGMK